MSQVIDESLVGSDQADTCLDCGAKVRPVPPRYEPYLKTLERMAPGWPYLREFGWRKVPADWIELVAEMTDVQRLVHLTARWTQDDIDLFADRQFSQAKATYEEAVSQEMATWGCTGRGVLGEGPELSAVRERIDWASTSVAHTYNYEMAREIRRIGEETPTANRHVYAYRLFNGANSWDGRYWADKSAEVAQIETMTAINAAKADFYNRNPQLYELQGEAWVVPLDTVCEVCAAYVAANPYDSMEEIYRRTILPAHPGCPHVARLASKVRKLRPQECADLWVGV